MYNQLFNLVLSAVSEKTGVSPEQMLSKSKSPNIANARNLAIWIMMNNVKFTSPHSLKERFGFKYQGSIRYSVNEADRMIHEKELWWVYSVTESNLKLTKTNMPMIDFLFNLKELIRMDMCFEAVEQINMMTSNLWSGIKNKTDEGASNVKNKTDEGG